MLDRFDDVFQLKKGLPPPRPLDHAIPLKSNSKSVRMRAYRYPVAHKKEIETMVQELLVSGLIRPSTSPFASPVLLVKKKNGSWRMCVDYRELNHNYSSSVPHSKY